jgi:hypothetical protein
MNCEETQQALSQYVDDGLPLPARVSCDEHLRQCPLCRAQLSELRALTRGLAALSRPVPPSDLAYSITNALAIEAAAQKRQPALPLSVRFIRWLEPRMMPYTIGSLASVILFISMFGALRPHLIALRDAENAARASNAANYRILYVQATEAGAEITKPVPTEGYPSLNPSGALAALTSSNVHGQEGDDDMVVVADVFSNGRAALADVVEAPRDRRMLDEFQHALRQGAAFVPASYDRRPQTMRVVFVIQKVAVREQDF